MLQFYYHPLSPIARRVWLALLEKEIPFETRMVDLKAGEHLQPPYLSLNPFHHVPVLVDGTFRVLESFAILDYLEARFPYPSLLPSNPSAIAQTRMVQMVVANELIPKLPLLVSEADATPDPATMLPVESVLMFLAEQLGTADFFGGDRLSLADITAGAAVPLVRRLGYPLGEDTALARWCNRLMERSAWQETEPSEAALEIWKRWILAMVKRRQRQIKV